jgi:hypothetical protein
VGAVQSDVADGQDGQRHDEQQRDGEDGQAHH